MTNPIRLLGFGDDITKVRNEIKNNIRLLSSVDTQKKLIKAVGTYNKTLHSERFKKYSPRMSYKSGRAFFELIAIPTLQQVKREPYKIHPSLIMIIEGLYLFSDLSKLEKIFKKEGKRLSSYLRLEKCCGRFAHFNFHKMESYLRSKGENEKIMESLSHQLPESDPDFDFLFAFTLRQMPLNKIANFLVHQGKLCKNPTNYFKFLNLLLIDYKGIIPKKVRVVTKDWIKDTLTKLKKIKNARIASSAKTYSAPKTREDGNKPHLEQFENKVNIVSTKKNPLEFAELPKGWVRIPSKLFPAQIIDFLSFFKDETNDCSSGTPFITGKDFEIIKKYGLAYPVAEPEKKAIQFTRTNRKTYGMFYHMLFKLYEKNKPLDASIDYKMNYAKFLKYNIEGIDASLQSILDNMNNSRPSKLKEEMVNKYVAKLNPRNIKTI